MDELGLCKQVAKVLGFKIRRSGFFCALCDAFNRRIPQEIGVDEDEAYRALLTWAGAGVIVEEMQERGWQFRLSSGESQQEYYAEFWQPAGGDVWTTGATNDRAPLAVLAAALTVLEGPRLRDCIPEVPEGYHLPKPDNAAGGGRPC